MNKPINIKLNGDTVAKIVVFDCEGCSKVSFYKKKSKFHEQNYANGIVSDNTFQMYNRIEEGYIDYAMTNVVPKREGYARYYDAMGKIRKEELWKNDMLITSKQY